MSGATLPSGPQSDFTFSSPIIDQESPHLALAIPCCSATTSGLSRQWGECQPWAAGHHLGLAEADLRLHLRGLGYVCVIEMMAELYLYLLVL